MVLFCNFNLAVAVDPPEKSFLVWNSANIPLGCRLQPLFGPQGEEHIIEGFLGTLLASEISPWLFETPGGISNGVRRTFEAHALLTPCIVSWCFEALATVPTGLPHILWCLSVTNGAIPWLHHQRLLETPAVAFTNLLSPVGLETVWWISQFWRWCLETMTACEVPPWLLVTSNRHAHTVAPPYCLVLHRRGNSFQCRLLACGSFLSSSRWQLASKFPRKFSDFERWGGCCRLLIYPWAGQSLSSWGNSHFHWSLILLFLQISNNPASLCRQITTSLPGADRSGQRGKVLLVS